jgi:hypothetical protein
MVETRHVRALYARVKRDLSRISFVIAILIQIFLFAYYSFAIYSHLGSTRYVVAYSLCLSVSLAVFVEQIVFRVNYAKKEESEIKANHKMINRVFGYIGLANKLLLLSISVVPIVKGEASDFDKVMTLVLSALILLQGAFLFFAFLLGRYMEWLVAAVTLDYKESAISYAIHPKQTLAEKFRDYASSLGREPSENDFETVFGEELAGVEKDRQAKQGQKKEGFGATVKEGMRLLKENKEKKRDAKKMSEIGKAYEKSKKEALRLLGSQKRLDAFLVEAKTALTRDMPKGLEYLFPLYDIARSDLGKQSKIRALINLCYFLSPLIPNSRSIEDNLLINEMSQEEYGLSDGSKTSKAKSI